MKRILALFLSLTIVTGCSSANNPWQPQASAPAMAAPSGIVPGVAQAQMPPVQPMMQAEIQQQPNLAAQPAPMPAAMQQMPPVKVALLLPMSGSNASLGEAMMQAAQLALFDMGYQNFELMPRDTNATPEGARLAAEGAINEGAQLLLGPLFSAEVKAVKPVAAMHNINMVAFSTDWVQAGGNAFIMGFLPFSQVQRIVGYSVARGYKRIALIAPQTDYGNAVSSYFTALASHYGIQSPPVTRIPANQKDLQPVAASFVQAAAGQPVDAVLIAVGGEQASTLAGLLTNYGMGPDKVRRLGTGLWDESALAQDPNMSGAWYAAPQPDLRRQFESKYRDTYGQQPPRLATLAYDATALAAVLARNGFSQGRNAPAFDRASLTNPNGFSGIDGIFRFQNDGQVDRGMAVLQMNGGSTSVIDPAPSTFQRQAF